jgi:hypothetical protein
MRGQLSLELMFGFMMLISVTVLFLAVQNNANAEIKNSLDKSLETAKAGKYESLCFLNSLNKNSLRISFKGITLPKNHSCLNIEGKRWFKS